MESNPGESKPASPVVAAEQIYSTNARDESDEFDPYDVVLKRMLRLEVFEVVGKADYTYSYVDEGDNGHGKRAFVHVDKGSPISQCWPRVDVPCAYRAAQRTFSLVFSAKRQPANRSEEHTS